MNLSNIKQAVQRTVVFSLIHVVHSFHNSGDQSLVPSVKQHFVAVCVQHKKSTIIAGVYLKFHTVFTHSHMQAHHRSGALLVLNKNTQQQCFKQRGTP